MDVVEKISHQSWTFHHLHGTSTQANDTLCTCLLSCKAEIHTCICFSLLYRWNLCSSTLSGRLLCDGIFCDSLTSIFFFSGMAHLVISYQVWPQGLLHQLFCAFKYLTLKCPWLSFLSFSSHGHFPDTFTFALVLPTPHFLFKFTQ